jgi:uncharacterized protein (TIGR03083 family)
MRDLVQHMGGIHRWAAAHVADRLTSPIKGYEGLVGGWPADAGLVDWFREGHANLVRVLEAAEPDVQCWSFLPAPSPLAFWARRQAHETGIHRADAESAGGPISAYDPAVAVDGLDELLLAFLPRPRTQLRADPPRTLHVHATDVSGEWLVRINPDSVQVATEHAEADCTLRGPASDLYLLLWNRRSPEGLELDGDAALLALWRERVQVRWS